MLRHVTGLLSRKTLKPPWLRTTQPTSVCATSSVQEQDELLDMFRRAARPSEVVSLVVEWAPLQKHWRQKVFNEEHKTLLDFAAAKIMSQSALMSATDKVKILCAFGEVIPDVAKYRRSPKRYLTAKVMWRNEQFFATIANQIDTVPASARLAVVRALSRVQGEAGQQLLKKILSEISTELELGGVEVNPEEITEIALHCSRKFAEKSFPELERFMQVVSDEIGLQADHFSEDQVTDFLRAAEKLTFPVTAVFVEMVQRKFPVSLPTMAWWNLADICAYGTRYPGYFGQEISRRIVNELFKYIPYFPGEDLRKILLFQREASDRRTFRHTLRFLNRRTHELTISSCADVFPFSAHIPKLRAKLGFRLADNIRRLSSESLVTVAESLQAADFQVAAAIRRRLDSEKNSLLSDRIRLALDRLDAASAQCDEASPQLLADVASATSQTWSPEISAFQLSRHLLNVSEKEKRALIDAWLQLPSRNERDLLAGLKTLISERSMESVDLRPAVDFHYRDSTVAVEVSGCLYLLNAADWWRPLSLVNQFLIHSETQEISDLLCMVTKLTNWPQRIPDDLVKYLRISGRFETRLIGNSSEFFWPEISGCVRDLKVAGIHVPMALTHLDVRQMHRCRNFRHLARFLANHDCGTLFFGEEQGLKARLRDVVLKKLGFDVRYVRDVEEIQKLFAL